MNLETGLSYDDILIRPQRSPVASRADVSLDSTVVADHDVEVPIISAPMDTVTEHEMAQAMDDAGGVGIIHRFLPIDDHATEVATADCFVGATIGVNDGWRDRRDAVLDAGADFLCVDVAHGHMEKCLDVVTEVNDTTSVPIMAGNVATGDGAVDLARAGADTVKVGIGPGSHCLTREVAGVGVPQVTAIHEAATAIESDYTLDADNIALVADGGIQTSGDIVKALTVGADTVMIGGLLAGCEESPAPVVERVDGKYKRTHGMASDEARDEHDLTTDEATEGAAGLTPYAGPVREVLADLAAGVRSGISYCGAHTIGEARENAEFIRVSPTVPQRNGTHGVYTNRD